MFRFDLTSGPLSDDDRFDTAEEARALRDAATEEIIAAGGTFPAIISAPERRHRDLAPAIVRELLGEDDPSMAVALEDCLDWSLCSPYSDPADWTVTLEEGGGPPRLLVDFLDGLAPERV